MCGFSGLFQPGGWATQDVPGIVGAMNQALRHRGPDASGLWADAAAGVCLGHRRLAVLDTSPAGAQPMSSASGRFTVVYNGEIYNHLSIRAELAQSGQAPQWRGTSDTETLLAAVDAYGVEGALERCVGMFAFAIWDAATRTVVLARDRLGEKPLYYGWVGTALVFASELTAIEQHPEFSAELCNDALADYLRRGVIAAPATIYRSMRKLSPAATLTVGPDAAPGQWPEPSLYWDIARVAQRGQMNPLTHDPQEALARLESALNEAVRGQQIADVPLGAFLSGGVDSTTVVGVLQAQSAQPVRTFTMGFEDDAFNEADHARAIAHQLGTQHTELTVTPRMALDVIPNLGRVYDEPFGDSSAIPTYLVAGLAREHVTVALSGDGGDELFGGYARYRRAGAAWRRLGPWPRPVRGLASMAATLASRSLPGERRRWKLERVAHYLAARDAASFYAVQTALRLNAERLVDGSDRGPDGSANFAFDASFLNGMKFTDLVTYLPDDILVKVDRAAMAHSLETRVPLLDHRLVELAWQLPDSMSVRDGEQKWLLKRLLEKYVPSALTDRPKSGFSVPLGQWLAGPLREWAEALLSEQRLRNDGVFDVSQVRRAWAEQCADPGRSPDSIWPILMFQQWYDARR